MNLTAYHAKYFAHDLTRKSSGGMDRLSMALFDASVDLNPHQMDVQSTRRPSRSSSAAQAETRVTGPPRTPLKSV